MIDVLEVIPFGIDNAISRGDLVDLLGVPDREIRAAIESASTREHPIINVGTGYFRPSKDDDDYVRQYIGSTRRRYVSLIKRVQELNFYLDEHSMNQINLEGME